MTKTRFMLVTILVALVLAACMGPSSEFGALRFLNRSTPLLHGEEKATLLTEELLTALMNHDSKKVVALMDDTGRESILMVFGSISEWEEHISTPNPRRQILDFEILNVTAVDRAAFRIPAAIYSGVDVQSDQPVTFEDVIRVHVKITSTSDLEAYVRPGGPKHDGGPFDYEQWFHLTEEDGELKFLYHARFGFI